MNDETQRIEEGYEDFMNLIRERAAGISGITADDVIGAVAGGQMYTAEQKEASQQLHNCVDTELLNKLVTAINQHNDDCKRSGRTNYAINNIATLAALSYACILIIVDNGDGNERTIDQTSAAVGDYIHMLCMADLMKRKGMN